MLIRLFNLLKVIVPVLFSVFNVFILFASVFLIRHFKEEKMLSRIFYLIPVIILSSGFVLLITFYTWNSAYNEQKTSLLAVEAVVSNAIIALLFGYLLRFVFEDYIDHFKGAISFLKYTSEKTAKNPTKIYTTNEETGKTLINKWLKRKYKMSYLIPLNAWFFFGYDKKEFREAIIVYKTGDFAMMKIVNQLPQNKDKVFEKDEKEVKPKIAKIETQKEQKETQLTKKIYKKDLPDNFDQPLIIAQINELRDQPGILKKYMYSLKQRFSSEREIDIIGQWEKQINANIALVNAMTEGEKAKAEFYKTKGQQEIIDAEVEKEKALILAKMEADVREEEVREADARARIAEAEAKIAEAKARARKAGQSDKQENRLEKLEKEIKEDAAIIRLKFQQVEDKLTALAELEKKIRTQLAGEDDLIEKYVDLAKRFVFQDSEL